MIREKRKLRNKQKLARGQTSGKLIFNKKEPKEPLVEILAFCFMPNHIHLLSKQLKDGGITKLMNKIGAGYGGYFNRKYQRKGYVFQNRFSAIHIQDDNQLKIVYVYIHTNPISLIEPKWKEKGIKNPEKAIEFLEDYKWSSYPDYIGKKNFVSVTDRGLILEIINSEQACKELVDNWIRYKGTVREIVNPALE